MATKAKIARNEHRKAVVARYAARRAELKAVIARPTAAPEEKADAQRELARQPRDASATRVRNRDSVDGRPRGHLRAFGVSRVRLRGLVHEGYLPGVQVELVRRYPFPVPAERCVASSAAVRE